MAKLVVNPDPKDINWTNEESYLFYNPEWPTNILNRLSELQKQIENHPSRLWLMTSGSQSFPKCVSLTKRGFLEAARSVVQRYSFKVDEVWLNSLPTFHVGGLSVWARAKVIGQRIVSFGEWSPRGFHDSILKERAQWTSLVPTQIYDLVQLELSAPQSLRGVFVGGGPLRHDLYWAARDLKWPVLPTYGMTEAGSQVATANLESIKFKTDPKLQLLEHIKMHIAEDGRVGVEGPSVTDLMAQLEGADWKILDPRDAQGIYWTQDSGELKGSYFTVKGRADDLKKIRGELVSLSQLQGRLDQVLLELRCELGSVIHFLPDDRTGYKVVLVLTPQVWKHSEEIRLKLRARCAPYEQVERIYVLTEIPTSDLGKVKRDQLEKILLQHKPV